MLRSTVQGILGTKGKVRVLTGKQKKREQVTQVVRLDVSVGLFFS